MMLLRLYRLGELPAHLTTLHRSLDSLVLIEQVCMEGPVSHEPVWHPTRLYLQRYLWLIHQHLVDLGWTGDFRVRDLCGSVSYSDLLAHIAFRLLTLLLDNVERGLIFLFLGFFSFLF